MKRIWAWSLWGLLCVAILAVVFNGNAIVGAYIGAQLEKVFGVNVEISQTEWDILHHQLRLKDISIGNPPGYGGNMANISSAVVDYRWGEVFGTETHLRRIDLHIRELVWIHNGDDSNLKQFDMGVSEREKQSKSKTRIDLLHLTADSIRYIKDKNTARVVPLRIKDVPVKNLQGNRAASEEILGTIIDRSGLVKPATNGKPGNAWVRFGNNVASSVNKGVNNVGRFFKNLFKKK